MAKTGGATAKALLGLLSIHPMSGYDVRQLIPWSIGHFWSESYGQIYPALKQMTAAGLVVKKTERQKGKPDRNVYSLTQAGRDELQAWLSVPAEEPVPRFELMLKLFFGAHAAEGVNRRHVEEFMAAQAQMSDAFQRVASGEMRREYRDHRLEWMIKSGGMEVVRDGIAKNNIRFTWPT